MGQSRYYNPQWCRWISADVYCDTGDGILGTNMYAYCQGDPVNAVDPSGMEPITAATVLSVVGVVGITAITIFGTAYLTNKDFKVAVDGAIMAVVNGAINATPKGILAAFPGLGIAAATAISLVSSAYFAVVTKQYVNANKEKTVQEILKTKKGSIKQAPLPPGSPSWDDILKLTLGEIVRRAQKGDTGFDIFKKLLTDRRFNR